MLTSNEYEPSEPVVVDASREPSMYKLTVLPPSPLPSSVSFPVTLKVFPAFTDFEGTFIVSFLSLLFIEYTETLFLGDSTGY